MSLTYERRPGEDEGTHRLTPEQRQCVDNFTQTNLGRLEELAEACLVGNGQTRVAFNNAMNEVWLDGTSALQNRFPENNSGVKKYFQRQIEPFLSASVWWRRVFHKPQGYSGDYLAMDMMYCAKPLPRPGEHRHSHLLDDWFLSCPSAQACRNRYIYMVDKLKLYSDSGEGRIASLASGPCREVYAFLNNQANIHDKMQFVFIDIDEMAHDYARSLLKNTSNCHASFEFLQTDLIKVTLGKKIPSLEACNLVYSMGYIDYLEKKLLVRFIKSTHRMLAPGGILIIGQFAEHCNPPDRFSMEWGLDWNLIYRSEKQVRECFSQTSFGGDNICVTADSTGLVMFIEARKG